MPTVPVATGSSDELHRFERLATLAAVVQRAAMGRSKGRIHDDPNRPAVRAVDIGGGARFGDAGGGEGTTTVGGDPIGRPWRAERDPDIDGTTERIEAGRDGVPDDIKGRAADERRQEFDGDPAGFAAPAGIADVDDTDHAEVDDR